VRAHRRRSRPERSSSISEAATSPVDLLLLSSSAAPGTRFLEHALEPIAELVPRGARLLFVAYASGDPARSTAAMEEALGSVGVDVVRAPATWDAHRELAAADAVYVGGGNTFRLLRTLYSLELVDAIRARVRDGLPYLGASAGSNVACPSIGTTNDMPITDVPSFSALGLIPFQINPHYIDPVPASTHMGETRDERLEEFLEENDRPVLALREGAWVRVRDGEATLGGATGGRIFERGRTAYEVEPGADVSALLSPSRSRDGG
jgi:dipeptidase E